MAPRKRIHQSFTSWVQDGGDELTLFLADINENRVDEDDIPQDTRDDIEATIEQLLSLVTLAREEAQWRREEEEAESDPHKEHRHLQHERL